MSSLPPSPSSVPEDLDSLLKTSHSNNMSRRHFLLSVADYTSSFLILFYYLLSWDLIFVWLVTAGSTSFYYFYTPNGDLPLAASVSFTLLSLAVVFPLTFLINQSFATRQLALISLADVQALVLNISLAMTCWTCDRASLPSDFSSRARLALIDHIVLLRSLLLLPQVHRGRHLVNPSGRAFRARVVPVAAELRRSLAPCMIKMQILVEEMKKHGLPSK